MYTYISDDDQTNAVIKTHPWTETEGYPADRYYDFRANPALIPQALNSFMDWSAWSQWEGVQLFYKLLEWLNGPDSQFESNGCGFRGPHEHQQKDFWPGKLMTGGGLIFLFRDAKLNLSKESAAWATRLMPGCRRLPPLAHGKNISWLLMRSYEYLQQLNPELTGARVSICLFPTLYLDLPLEHNDKFGHEVSFRWWAWGNTEEETMAHFKEVVATMFECLKMVSAEAKTATR